MSIGFLVRTTETFEKFATRFLRPKFDKYLSEKERLEAITDFKQKSLLIHPAISITACRDHKDDKFLELAITAMPPASLQGIKTY